MLPSFYITFVMKKPHVYINMTITEFSYPQTIHTIFQFKENTKCRRFSPLLLCRRLHHNHSCPPPSPPFSIPSYFVVVNYIFVNFFVCRRRLSLLLILYLQVFLLLPFSVNETRGCILLSFLKIRTTLLSGRVA